MDATLSDLHTQTSLLPGAAEASASNVINYDQQHKAHGSMSGMMMDHGNQTDGQPNMAEMASMMMMKMYFHFGLGDLVLFRGFVMDSNTKLWLTCLALFLSAILLELIDYSRSYLSCRCRSVAASYLDRSNSSSEARLVAANGHPAARNQCSLGGPTEPAWNWSCCTGPVGGNHLEIRPEQSKYSPAASFFPVSSPDPHIYRLIQSSLQFVRTGISLVLMLAAMTYNLCLIFPILLGSAVGYYIFYRPALDAKSVLCH